MSAIPALGLATGAERLGTEGAFSVLARAKELERRGKDIIHLEIGEPDFDTPAHIVESAVAALRSGATRYCAAAGLPELREVAAEHIAATRDINVDASRVLIATGAKPFLFFGVLATCGPGDEVVYPDPGFPIYESAIRFAGATPIPLRLHERADFSFSVNELERCADTAHASCHSQLAAQPHWRSPPTVRRGAGSRAHRILQRMGVER